MTYSLLYRGCKKLRNGKEAEDTAKRTFQETGEILEKRTREVEALAGKAARDATH
jgi:hypothetical protein